MTASWEVEQAESSCQAGHKVLLLAFPQTGQIGNLPHPVPLRGDPGNIYSWKTVGCLIALSSTISQLAVKFRHMSLALSPLFNTE